MEGMQADEESSKRAGNLGDQQGAPMPGFWDRRAADVE